MAKRSTKLATAQQRNMTPANCAGQIRRALKHGGSAKHAAGVQWFFKDEIKSHGWRTADLRRSAIRFRREIRKAEGLGFLVDVADQLFSGLVLEEKIAAVFLLEKLDCEFGDREFDLFDSWLDRISSWADHDALVHYLIAPMVAAAEAPVRNVPGIAQNEAQASWSLWYDEGDQFLDWSQDAARLSRQVDAMGWPYTGARCRYRGKVVIVHEADALPDLAFENRRVGKIWTVAEGAAEVVCGHGLLRLRRCTGADGVSVAFDKVRARLE